MHAQHTHLQHGGMAGQPHRLCSRVQLAPRPPTHAPTCSDAARTGHHGSHVGDVQGHQHPTQGHGPHPHPLPDTSLSGTLCPQSHMCARTHTHTHTHTSHVFTGHTAAGTRVTDRQRPHHSLACVPGHHGQPCTHGPRHVHTQHPVYLPPKSRLIPSHAPTDLGRPARGHGQVDAGQEPGPPRSHRAAKPPTTAALRPQGSGTTPNRPHDCKLCCRAAFCQLPQQTLPPISEFALRVHCPAHTHTHVLSIHGAL